MKRKALFFKVIFIFVLVVAVFLFFGAISELLSTHKLRKQHAAVTKELEEIQKINASLTNQKEKLSDPNYIQTYARGNYMFSKEGEQIFYLPSVDKEKVAEDVEKDNKQEDKQQKPDDKNAEETKPSQEEKKETEEKPAEEGDKKEEEKPAEESGNQDNHQEGENNENHENGQ